ncbi:hypothetical protein ACH4K8_33190 [Streptomyces anulatus]
MAVSGPLPLLRACPLLRPLPVRSELFWYGVATACIEASGESANAAAYESWRDLIMDIQALRLTVYDVADRLRSCRTPGEADRRSVLGAVVAS